MQFLSTAAPEALCGPPAAGREIKQISATRDHIIARVIPRMSVLPLPFAMGSCIGLARQSRTGLYIMKWTKLPILWLRELSKRSARRARAGLSASVEGALQGSIVARLKRKGTCA